MPPHKDGRLDFAYHATVVRTEDDEVRLQASAAIAPHLPLQVQGAAFWAADGSPDGGGTIRRW